jgi:hypothetical protein
MLTEIIALGNCNFKEIVMKQMYEPLDVTRI